MKCIWCENGTIKYTNIICRTCNGSGEIKMSKIEDAIKYLQSKVNNTHFVKIMKVLNQNQNQSLMKLVILAKSNSPELESKGREFIKSLTDFQKEELSNIVGKDVVDKLSESLD